ncbi:MAG: hypothetical protein ACPIOQ_71225, partial [Promethearchaeia archaeon]
MTRAVRWLVAPARRLSLRAPAASGGSWPLTERPMALAGCSEPQRPGARLLARALSASAGGEAPPSDGAAEKKVRRRQEVGLSEWGDRLRGRTLLVELDNSASVGAARRFYSKAEDMQELIRRLLEYN